MKKKLIILAALLTAAHNIHAATSWDWRAYLPSAESVQNFGMTCRQWISDNPGKAAAVGSALAGLGYLGYRSLGKTQPPATSTPGASMLIRNAQPLTTYSMQPAPLIPVAQPALFDDTDALAQLLNRLPDDDAQLAIVPSAPPARVTDSGTLVLDEHHGAATSSSQSNNVDFDVIADLQRQFEAALDQNKSIDESYDAVQAIFTDQLLEQFDRLDRGAVINMLENVYAYAGAQDKHRVRDQIKALSKDLLGIQLAGNGTVAFIPAPVRDWRRLSGSSQSSNADVDVIANLQQQFVEAIDKASVLESYYAVQAIFADQLRPQLESLDRAAVTNMLENIYAYAQDKLRIKELIKDASQHLLNIQLKGNRIAFIPVPVRERRRH